MIRLSRLVIGTAVLLIASGAAAKSNCNAALWQHVYKPERLDVVTRCTSVTGTILDWRVEDDGDYHILLKLDAGQTQLLNKHNRTRQHGCLVLEPICKRDVKQVDAIEPCRHTPNVPVPEKGSHVRVWGSYVHDTEGGHGWMEIHPVSKFVVLP